MLALYVPYNCTVSVRNNRKFWCKLLCWHLWFSQWWEFWEWCQGFYLVGSYQWEISSTSVLEEHTATIFSTDGITGGKDTVMGLQKHENLPVRTAEQGRRVRALYAPKGNRIRKGLFSPCTQEDGIKWMFMHCFSGNEYSLILSLCKRKAHITCPYVRKLTMSDIWDTNTLIVQFVYYVSMVLGLINLFSSCDFVLLKCSIWLLRDVKTCKTKVRSKCNYNICVTSYFWKWREVALHIKKKFL